MEELNKINACIHCGICLSSCPTYLSTGNEGNSPRGRLYLIKDLIQNKVSKLDNKSREYLDNCLACQACETACPSGVQYISLLDYVRHEKSETAYNTGFWGLFRSLSFNYLLANRSFLNLGRRFLNFINYFYRLLPSLPRLNRIQPLTNISYKPLAINTLYRSSDKILDKTDAERTVIFNLGCVMDTLYNQVHHDTIKVLNAAGYHVFIPNSQCCGALATHSGEFKIGEKHTNQFIDAQCEALTTLEGMNLALPGFSNFIVFNSAGCGAHVKDKVFAESLVVRDIGELLDPVNWKAPLPLEIFKSKLGRITDFLEGERLGTKEECLGVNSERTTLKAVYHPACHLQHAQGLTTQYQNLLSLISGLELIPVMEAEVCCGSAGFYNLIKPKLAELIGERKAANIKATAANFLITANPGCMSQIQAHLGDAGRVFHPMSVLAKIL